jgi:phage gpG-like protein
MRTQRWNIEQQIKDFKKMKSAVPKRIGNMALNHFLESWDNEAFSDRSTGDNSWKKRSTRTKADIRTGKNRKLLIQSGALKRSMKVSSAGWSRIVIGSYGIIYASRHNQGLAGMPKRQFIGRSRILDQKILKMINNEMKKIL